MSNTQPEDNLDATYDSVRNRRRLVGESPRERDSAVVVEQLAPQNLGNLHEERENDTETVSGMQVNSYLNIIAHDNTETINEIVNSNMYAEYKELEEFLNSDVNFKTEKLSPHTNIISRRGKHHSYNIPQLALDRFFALLNRLRRIKEIHLHFLEKQLEYSGIVIDIDMFQPKKEHN